MTHNDILQRVYDRAMDSIGENNIEYGISNVMKNHIDTIIANLSKTKSILAVLVTLITHKIYDPAQDIRLHQSKMEKGFSGRNIDKNHITPFLRRMNFPSNAETGWLTRNFEQTAPYDFNYPYKVNTKLDAILKEAFLNIINEIQCNGVDAEETLFYFFVMLIRDRDSKNIDLAKPHNLTISTIISHLEKHFTYQYKTTGASRLPVLALYASYQCMMGQVARYRDKSLCSLESHNSADRRSGSVGDIQVNNADGTPYEGVEVKHEIKINTDLVMTAYDKFMPYRIDRYYLLTTANMDSADWDSINAEIEKIRSLHGCQVIVNGVYSTLRYYLRLMEDTAEFIDNYVELLKADGSVKYQHKEVWNLIVAGRA